MVRIELHEEACRGCEMCVDVCPTDVFTFDAGKSRAQVNEVEDCIACLSCTYLCPSGAIRQYDYHEVKNFYRDIEFTRRVEKFL